MFWPQARIVIGPCSPNVRKACAPPLCKPARNELPIPLRCCWCASVALLLSLFLRALLGKSGRQVVSFGFVWPPHSLGMPFSSAPVRTPVRTPFRIPVRTPVRLSVRTPMRSPIRIAVRTAVRIPVRSPVRIPVRTPVRSELGSSSNSSSNAEHNPNARLHG